MDSKAKIRKLRELSTPSKLIAPDGPLDRRLAHLYDKTTELRNRIAHGWLVQAKGVPQTLLIANIAKLPFRQFKMVRRHGSEPDRITFEALNLHATWLYDFGQDMISLFQSAKKQQPLELRKPHSMEPKELQRRLQSIEKKASEHPLKQSPPNKK
jgi:hypothetical protein